MASGRQLSRGDYQKYKIQRDEILRTFQQALGDLRVGNSVRNLEDKLQQEARFKEARLRALRSAFKLPRVVDYFTDPSKNDPYSYPTD